MTQPSTEEDKSPMMPQFTIPGHLPAGPSEDFFKYKIDGNDILEEIEHQLRGEKYDPKQEKYVQTDEPWLNDDWINKVLHVIYSCGINKGTFLGNLTTDQILFKCNRLKKELAKLFYRDYREAGVSKSMRTLLITTIMNPIHSGLSRSEGGLENKRLSEGALRHDIYSHNEEINQKKGILSKLPFMR